MLNVLLNRKTANIQLIDFNWHIHPSPSLFLLFSNDTVTENALHYIAFVFPFIRFLKWFVLFIKPSVFSERSDLRSRKQVEEMQETAEVLLRGHTGAQGASGIIRFGKLLLVLPALRSFPSTPVNELFFGHSSDGSSSTPVERFIGNLLIRKN